MSDSSIEDIFKSITTGFHQNHNELVQEKVLKLVNATLTSYNRLVQFLLPIPVKSH
jgi:hypothetical protein